MAACASSPEQTNPKSACGSKPRPGRRFMAKSRRREVLLSTISFLPAAASRLKQSSAPARERFPSWSTPNWSRSTASYRSAISHRPGTTVPLLRTGPASRGRARPCMLPTWVVLTPTARRAIGSASMAQATRPHQSRDRLPAAVIPNLQLNYLPSPRLACSRDPRARAPLRAASAAAALAASAASAADAADAMPKPHKPKSAAQGNGHIFVYAAVAAVAVFAYAMSSSSEPRQKPPHTPKSQPNRNRKDSAKIFAEAFELYSKRDMSAAAKRFEDYLRLEPKDVSALNNLGLVHTELSDFDAAIGSFKRVLAIDAAHADAHSNLGIAYGKAGRAHESRAAYAAALRANPAHANAAGNLALELTKDEPPRWQEAVAVLEAVLGQEAGAQDLAPTRQILATVQEKAKRAGVDLSLGVDLPAADS
eukprot:scaffold91144_cov67-Phaeocystis_antarctica.AAC.7